MIRRVVVSFAILAALLAAADFGLRVYSQSVVGEEIRSSLKLSQKPSVTFTGWPFIPHLLSGDLPSVSVSADSFGAGGVRLRKVALSLQDVHFPSRRLISGGGGEIHADTGHGTAVLTGADVTTALHREGVPFNVSIRAGRASATARGLRVGLDVKLQGDTVVLTPAAVGIGSARIGLPAIVHGLSYSRLALRGTEAVLTIRLRNAVFVVP